jgi:propionyl-CoA carboxylase alpha chain
MGDKIASKKLAGAAKVNVIPGHDAAIESAELAVEIARKVGYPVMIKASAGGGGKGLRVARDDAEAAEGWASCRSEARNAFGDDRVFIEKFVERPRHIEIQVLGDAHGHCVYLWERECSIQRRHQKVVEEAPSPFLDERTRAAMGEQAVALAKAVSYQSAGTVEFVVGADRSFYFLEMNTRLQVEHPVTECITGIDLVEQMIRVAAGEPLAFTQGEIARKGHAIECRVNAEDPVRGFLPSTGRLVVFSAPATTLEAGVARGPGTPGLRLDTGVYEGGEIPMHYDSMVGKLIACGTDRADAIARMRAGLDAFVVRGVQTNLAFQSALLAHPRFASGDFDTGFIAEEWPEGFGGVAPADEQRAFLLALAAVTEWRWLAREGRFAGAAGRPEPTERRLVAIEQAADGRTRSTPLVLHVDGGAVVVESEAWRTRIALGGALRSIGLDGTWDGRPFRAQAERQGLRWRVSQGGATLDVRIATPKQAEMLALVPWKAPPDLSRFLLSPMPGLLVHVAVVAGQEVHAGERLAVVEAMKMENALVAQRNGRVARVVAQQGDSLAVDQVILEFEA